MPPPLSAELPDTMRLFATVVTWARYSPPPVATPWFARRPSPPRPPLPDSPLLSGEVRRPRLSAARARGRRPADAPPAGPAPPRGARPHPPVAARGVFFPGGRRFQPPRPPAQVRPPAAPPPAVAPGGGAGAA